MKRIVGVDVTAKSIRAVQMLHKSGQRPIVEKFIEYPIQASSSDEGLSKGQILGGQLKLVWAAAGFKTKSVAFGIGGHDVFVKEFEVPDLPKSKLRKLLPDLAKGELPMSLDEVVLDFYANRRITEVPPGHSAATGAGKDKGEPEAHLGGMLVAANRAAIDLKMEAAKVAKLNVESIDLIPFALSRNLSKRFTTPGVRVFVRAANSFINIIVTDDTAVRFVRMVPWELSALHLTPLSKDEDSESAGIVLDFTDASTSEISVIQTEDETQTAIHRQAVRELDDTMRYFNISHPDKHIDEILVSGVRLDNSAFLGMLQKGREVRVTGITRSGLGHRRSTVSTVDSSDVPDHLAVALALAEAVSA